MKGMRLTKKNISLIVAFILLLITTFQQIGTQKSSLQNQNVAAITPIASHSSQLATVKRVIDGDTIELDDGQVVRYIGINTPELHDPRKPVECFGKEAAEENKKLVEGKQVRLEKDVSETDRYKRLLRFVYVPTEASPSGQFVNEYLIKEGYAYASTYPPDVKYADYFKQLQKDAQINEKGLWLKCR